MEKDIMNTIDTSGLLFDYKDRYMALTSNLGQMHRAPESFINEFNIVLLVESGQLKTSINHEEYTLKQGDIVFCAPGNLLKRGMVSMDFACRVVFFSPEGSMEMLKETHMSFSHYMSKGKMQFLHLTPQEQKVILSFYDLIVSLSPLPDDEVREQVVRRLQQSFAYSITGLFVHRGYTYDKHSGTSAENLFRKFVHLLKEYPEGRSVQFYADKLFVTAKYFNSICKQVSGKTASTLINEEVVNMAKILLKDPSLSIKEVSSMLGFTNQSHFGSFLRREVGMSPQVLRRKLLS